MKTEFNEFAVYDFHDPDMQKGNTSIYGLCDNEFYCDTSCDCVCDARW